MKSQVTTTPHPEHKRKSEEEKKAMRRPLTTDERIKFLDNRNKFNQTDHDESLRAAKDLASRDE